MRRARLAGISCALMLLVASGGGHARAQAVSAVDGGAPATTQDALHALARRAAVIFAGRVVAVRRPAGVVAIEFAVDDAVRGTSGGNYTLREWAGLWPAGEQPFRAGQRYLMLLHAPSAAGLSSPVGGADGAIPVRGEPAPTDLGQGTPAAAIAGTVSAVDSDADTRTVDLRWVATGVVRTVAYRAESVARPIGMPSGVHAEAIAAMSAQTPAAASDIQEAAAEAPAVSAGLGAATQNVAYATVLALLRSWERDDAAR